MPRLLRNSAKLISAHLTSINNAKNRTGYQLPPDDSAIKESISQSMDRYSVRTSGTLHIYCNYQRILGNLICAFVSRISEFSHPSSSQQAQRYKSHTFILLQPHRVRSWRQQICWLCHLRLSRTHCHERCSLQYTENYWFPNSRGKDYTTVCCRNGHVNARGD